MTNVPFRDHACLAQRSCFCSSFWISCGRAIGFPEVSVVSSLSMYFFGGLGGREEGIKWSRSVEGKYFFFLAGGRKYQGGGEGDRDGCGGATILEEILLACMGELNWWT